MPMAWVPTRSCAERSRNLQFGANLSASSLLTDGDLAQLRVTPTTASATTSSRSTC